MNCLDFRRAYLADPYHLEAEQEAHMHECDACARYANRQAVADRKLEAALRIPVSKDLSANVIFERSIRSRRRGLRVFAMAAGVVLTLAAVLGITLLNVESGPDLQQQFIAHMVADPIHMQGPAANASAELQKVALDLGINMDAAGMGQIIGARNCDVDGHQAAHFVVEENGVRATAFLVPNESLSKHEWLVNSNGQHGMMIPTEGGVIAVFCPERQMLVRLSEQLENSVQWTAS